MRLLILASTLLLFSTIALASEEEFLDWSEVHIVSAGNQETGRVAFSATRAADGACRAVEAEAFGKKFTLDDKQCRLLSDFPLSSLSTTHAGYEQLGGHTVYFKFRRSFRRNNELIDATLIIAISRGKGLEVHEPQERVVGERKP